MDVVKIIKKNMSIIIPAAIALCAVLLLVPSVLVRGKIAAKLQESANLGRDVDSALSTVVSAKQPGIAKIYQDTHQSDANQIDTLSVQTTQRGLLSYKIFPEPNETSMQIFNEFKKAYSAVFANFVKDLKALDAPTNSEIQKLAGAITIPTDFQTTPAAGQATGDEKIIELICKSRSEEIPVYANPWIFNGYGFWNNWEYKGSELAVRDCWYCQLACWIHQDVIDTIKSMNAGSNSVAQSSVKRILAVGFNETGRENSVDTPVYVTGTSGGLCQPWTGRICDDKIDVVHFYLNVIVKADDILKFMTELCSEKEHTFTGYKGELPEQKYKHNQITVLGSSVMPVDRNSQSNKRYYYGADAVVQLNLICEYVFIRQGYDVIKPQSIQNDISGASNTGGGEGGGGGTPGGGMGGPPGGMGGRRMEGGMP